tara:strand:- start:42670 stop:43104 length:435 start_codon:yes stop_codon:yes gene_type:complete
MEYISKYSNDKRVSAAQYITEIICEHKAKKEKKDLHFRFWQTSKYWEKYYRSQIATANKLLKTYSPQAIISALNDRKAVRIFSLRAPHLEPIIEHHQHLFDNNNSKPQTEIERVDASKLKSRKQYKTYKKSIMDILDDQGKENG